MSDQDANARALFAEGYGAEGISERLGITRYRADQLLKRLDLHRKRSARPPAAETSVDQDFDRMVRFNRGWD